MNYHIIWIRTFAPSLWKDTARKYSHIPDSNLHCTQHSLSAEGKRRFGIKAHAAHVFAPGQNTGKIVLANYLGIGFVPWGTVWKHELFSPDFPRIFLTLTLGCPWVKKCLPITGATEKRIFWSGRPRFWARTSITRRVLKKLCAKKVCVYFWPVEYGSVAHLVERPT